MMFASRMIVFAALSVPGALLAQATNEAAPAADAAKPGSPEAQAAAAPPASAKAIAAVAKTGRDPNKIICKTEDVLGSRVQKEKSCLTAAQWREKAFLSGQWAEHQTTYNSQPNGR